MRDREADSTSLPVRRCLTRARTTARASAGRSLRSIPWTAALLFSISAQAQLIPETATVFSQQGDSPRTDLASPPEDGDEVGRSLASGDFDGDGHLDLVIGVPGEDRAISSTESITDSGWVHVVPGTPGGLSAEQDQIWDQSGAIEGAVEPGDEVGFSVTTGDFDGDGFDDLVMGSPLEAIGSEDSAGAVNVIYGSASGLVTDGNRQFHQDTPGISGGAEAGDLMGVSLAAGDFDNDGFDELVWGVPFEALGADTNAGAIQVLTGTASGLVTTGDLFLDRGDLETGAVAEDERFGFALAVGDFNGDSFADLAIGVPHDSTSATQAGSVHLVYGGPDGLDLSSDQNWSLDSPGIPLSPAAFDHFGTSLTVGNFDGDGFDDLAVGITGYQDNDGAALILYGTADGLASDRNRLVQPGHSGFVGESGPNALFGSSITAGDINGDGADELMARSSFDFGNANAAGSVLIAFGAPGVGLVSDNSVFWNRSDLEVVGDWAQGDRFGNSVLLDDFDNDGRADAVITSPQREVNGVDDAGDVVIVSTSASLFRDRFEPGPGATFRDCGDCPLMAIVPSGSFLMGDLTRQEEDALPLRTVDVPTFAVGVHEVTWDEWEACVAEGACDSEAGDDQGGDEGWGRGTRPRIKVDFNDVQDYVSWLSAGTNSSYRLLSEAEWEYAARAGTRTPFWWGTFEPIACDTDAINGANFDFCRPSNTRTDPVGSYHPNHFGLFDTHGNVWEFVQDCWNENYEGAPVDGSAWLDGNCDDRMVRGGAWNYRFGNLRTHNRGRWPVDEPTAIVGFRVAKDL